MPYKYNITNNATPPVADDYQWTGTNTLNQQSGDLSVPAGAITKLLVYAAGKDSAVNTRLILWTASGSALKQTATFSMSSGSTSVGGQSWREYSLSSAYVVASTTTYWIGLYRNPSGGHIAGTNNGTTGYRKTNTSSFPTASSMSGASSDNEELLVGVFYITIPDAPTGVSVSRVSDTKQTVTWTRTNPTNVDKPYTNQKIERWNNSSGTWSELSSTLSASATSYTDISTIANRQYKYRVRAWNAAGNGNYSSESAVMSTTPAAPTSLTAARAGSTIVLNWTKNTTIANYQTVERNVKSGGDWLGWSALSSTVSQSAITYTDTSLEAYIEFQYRVKATITTPVLSSTYATSNAVLVLQAPDAPSNLSPDALRAYGTDEDPITFTWQHNPTDSSTQTYFRLRFRAKDSADEYSYIDKTAGSESTYDWTVTLAEGDWEYQVQTWGALTTGGEDGTGGSPWSGDAYFKIAERPVVTILDPSNEGTYTSSLLTIEWEYTDLIYSQKEYILRLFDAEDNMLEEKTGIMSLENEETGSLSFDYPLENNTAYYITLLVSNSVELWSLEWAASSFTTLFLDPTTPVVEVDYNTGLGTANIEITNPDVVTFYINNTDKDSHTILDGVHDNDNFGSEDDLLLSADDVGGVYKDIYLGFDLSEIVGKTIVNAYLQVYRKDVLTPGIESCIKYLKTVWVESTITANNTPTIDATQYGAHAHTDEGENEYGEYEQWDITDLVELIAAGTITDFNGLLITSTTEDGSADSFYSKEYGLLPVLVVEIDPENAETEYNNVYRKLESDVNWQLIETLIPKNTGLVDSLPSISGVTQYYVEAVSATPTIKNSSVEEIDVLETGFHIVNSGNNYEDTQIFEKDTSLQEKDEQKQALVNYSGRIYPVPYKGIEIDYELSFSATIYYSEYDAFKTLIRNNTDFFYRDWRGRYFKCSILSPNLTRYGNVGYKFTCKIVRIDDQERDY
jgi:hypothetical protein